MRSVAGYVLWRLCQGSPDVAPRRDSLGVRELIAAGPDYSHSLDLDVHLGQTQRFHAQRGPQWQVFSRPLAELIYDLSTKTFEAFDPMLG